MFSTLVSKVSHNSGGFVLVMFFQWWPYLVIPTTSVTNGKQCQLPGSHSPPLMSVGIIQGIVHLVKTGSSTCMRSLIGNRILGGLVFICSKVLLKEAAWKTWWSLPFSLAVSPLSLLSAYRVFPPIVFPSATHRSWKQGLSRRALHGGRGQAGKGKN